MKCNECSKQAGWLLPAVKLTNEQVAEAVECSVEEVIAATDKFDEDGYIKKSHTENDNIFQYFTDMYLCDDHHDALIKLDEII